MYAEWALLWKTVGGEGGVAMGGEGEQKGRRLGVNWRGDIPL